MLGITVFRLSIFSLFSYSSQRLNKEQNDEECDATKMLREQKPVTIDCFGFASQDDSSNADGVKKYLQTDLNVDNKLKLQTSKFKRCYHNLYNRNLI